MADLATGYIELLRRTIPGDTDGRERTDNLWHCVQTVLGSHTPGDLMDSGAWQSGAGVLMRGMLKAYGVRHRRVWVADPQLSSSLDRAKSFFESFGLLDDNVRFLPGPLSNTLPRAGIERIAVLRISGSPIGVLSDLYPRISPGGFIIIDDYFAEGVRAQCALATDEFRTHHGITSSLERIDASSVFWQKQEYSNDYGNLRAARSHNPEAGALKS